MSAPSPLFRFVQLELPWQLGPPDGRYLLRPPDDPQAPATHVVVFATLGAPERRRLSQLRRQREAAPEPEPTAVSTGRATVVDVGRPLADLRDAGEWLEQAGEPELDRGIEVLNRTLHAFRVVTADPYQNAVSRSQAIVARVGFGAGEQVADGLWTDARELVHAEGRQRRARVLTPQVRLAAVLGARDRPLVCEELALRARLDLDHGREREAALQVLVTLDAALAELPSEPEAAALADRLTELRGQREPVAIAAQAALAGPLGDAELESVAFTLQRIEAALRARAVQRA
ncbi:MAG TPA: hypothetical protein VN880_18235 [Solirubrobacteraceae bacterium]|nr:hypothetical protein [Solirubrobacteraceae bacterium]